jgi:hypothetical protein
MYAATMHHLRVRTALYKRTDSRVAQIAEALRLPPGATLADILGAIQTLQRRNKFLHRSAARWAATHFREMQDHERTREKLRAARDPDNWVAVWTGDEAAQDPDSTILNHGNLITLDGTGQMLMHYRPPKKES